MHDFLRRKQLYLTLEANIEVLLLQPPASVQEDGAAYMDKIFLMKVLNTFERQTAVKHGLTKVGKRLKLLKPMYIKTISSF